MNEDEVLQFQRSLIKQLEAKLKVAEDNYQEERILREEDKVSSDMMI